MKFFWLTLCIAASLWAKAGDSDTAFNGGNVRLFDMGLDEEGAYAIAVDTTGRIVEAGSGGDGCSYVMAVARLDRNGSLDATFGNGGRVYIHAGSNDSDAASEAIAADGKIVVAGISRVSDTGKRVFTVVRLEENGSRDGGFGTNGIVTTRIHDANVSAYARAVTILPDKKILVAGYTEDNEVTLVRYLSDGTLDAAFGNGGIVLTPLGKVYSLAIQNDGKIVVGGYAHINAQQDYVFVRYSSEGALDTSFSDDGVAVFDHGGSDVEAVYDLAIDKQNRIVGVGSSSDGTSKALEVMRLLSDGTLDATFGNGGFVRLSGAAQGYALALQNDEKILVAGESDDNASDTAMLLARVHQDGTLDDTFGEGGIVISNIASQNERIWDIAIDGKGRLAASGEAENDSKYDWTAARYLLGSPVLAPVYYLLF